jgi:galactosylceramide sulfotransferase
MVRRGLVYVKTHKTAGSTLLNIILRISISLNMTCVSPANGHSGYGCPYHMRSSLDQGIANVFAQHVTFRPQLLHWITPRPPLLLTIMRDPIAQSISAYLYPAWKHLRQRVGGKNWTDHLARVERGVADNLACYYNNSQARDMGYDHFRDVDMLVRAYDAILLTEEFDRSLILLGALLSQHGWKVQHSDLSYAVVNRRVESVDAHLMQAMRAIVATSSLIAIDTQVYERARRRFEAVWAKSHLETKIPPKRCASQTCRSDYVDLMSKCSLRS